ncbi:HTH-type transcriptional regulator BenM [Usitatibacter rugosus]|uniref:HTH-type transcriptional regulator BenM n=2 Tax=Usitatibacter rugosus TaxID=2732067 RepID=A0A6M4H085_9PROT|nr:HTH-type transcriptional regulator BenM [Usitatibacter rugosus]
MELRHLRYFTAIAAEGNFTRAAERLGIQQPPLSQQLAALERELGVRLFDRLPRGVELTPAGSAFLEDSLALLERVDGATARARRVAKGVAGTLRIGFTSSAATHPAASDTIASFRTRYPDVHLSFLEGNAASLSEAVLGRHAQAAMVRVPVVRDPDLRFVQIDQEPLVAALAASHPLAQRARKKSTPGIGLRDLVKEPLILVRRPGAPGMYGTLLDACREAGLTPKIAAEVENMLTNLMLVAAGVGATVVPSSMRGILADRIAYLPVQGAGRMVAPLTLLTHREDTNPAVTNLIAVARRVLD